MPRCRARSRLDVYADEGGYVLHSLPAQYLVSGRLYPVLVLDQPGKRVKVVRLQTEVIQQYVSELHVGEWSPAEAGNESADGVFW